MKPNEICEIKGCSAYTEKAIVTYLNKDCVIAYNKNEMGCCFVIKTKKSYFVFCGIKEYFQIDSCNNFTRMGDWEISKFITDFQNKLTIIDEKEYSKFLKKRIVKELTK